MSYIATFDTQVIGALQELSLSTDWFIDFEENEYNLYEVEFTSEETFTYAIENSPELCETLLQTNGQFDPVKFFAESYKDFTLDPNEYTNHILKRATKLFAKYQTL